ncbi:Endonuclease III [Myxococcaceae bacterium]|jgi:endonuclease-3|nr:Endonuclease III [Myxococcaceae bacterium]
MPRESAAARGARALRIVRLLARHYPDASCALRHRNAFELLVATILSAQCTDKKVNEVTPALFERFPTPDAMSAASPAEVERLIQPTGFYRQKAKSILSVATDLVERFEGRVPSTLDALVTLRGVGRKTANVVLGDAFGVPGLTVDTHMTRVNQRLGLTRESDPEKIERDLMKLVPEREWTRYSHRVIHHGRVCCDARRPRCETCPLREQCPWPERAARA